MYGQKNPAVEASLKAAARQERLRNQLETKRRREENKREEVSDNKTERHTKSVKAHTTSRTYSKRYKSKTIHQQPPLYSKDYMRTEETSPKKKYSKKQIMGLNAEFARKRKDDEDNPAAMATNSYEEVGYDTNLEPQDIKKQLKRRKALKVVRAYVKEAGVWGSGSGGFAGLPAAGTQNTSQAGGIGNKLGPDSPDKNYILKKKKSRISVPDSAVGGARVTPNS
jgi:hypothetical protein